MQSQVESLSSELTLDEVLQAMSRSHHRGFPVLEEGKLVGIVTQTDLANLAKRTGLTRLREIMTPDPIAVRPDASLGDVLYLLNRYQLSRLPVTEHQHLIGIITRSDIIRVEANQWGGTAPKTAQTRPSYVAYQTRAPALGQGRLLLPLSNPQTALDLFQIAAGIARHHNYEIECLQVMPVPKHSLPEQVSVDLRESRKLLHRVERLGRQWQLPVHTQIRVAQDAAGAILEVMAERHPNLLLMGWKGSTSTPGAIFGGVTDTLIRQAPGDLVLVKLGTSPRAYPHHLKGEATWLVPMAGGPNVQRAVELLPGLTELYEEPALPQIWLCKIYPPSAVMPDDREIERTARSIQQQLHKPAVSVPIRSQSVSEAVIRLAAAKNCDAVLLGASREGLLQQVIHGNIPEAIAQGVDSTVILVRGARRESPLG
jgi:CIC family chloride channel protein